MQSQAETELITSTGWVKLDSITHDAQHHIAKCARVSNPSNQNNRLTEAKLLKYLAQHQHWSPFEMAHMSLEIKTTRAISAQIIRHRSFSFQEMSQRYSEQQEFVVPNLRRQDLQNRQNSIDDIPEVLAIELQAKCKAIMTQAFQLYDELIAHGVAKESARAILPLNTTTVIYMTGSIRSWIHYIQVRTHPDTQREHREVAEKAKELLLQQLPVLQDLL
jgi:thymidylate synthase (FAD)